MTIKAFAIVTAVSISALAGTAGTASAGGGHHHHHHHWRHFQLNVGTVYRDCSFYREMWEETGKFKWKRRYYECKGWW